MPCVNFVARHMAEQSAAPRGERPPLLGFHRGEGDITLRHKFDRLPSKGRIIALANVMIGLTTSESLRPRDFGNEG
jgi:hypothetical protein